MRGVQRQRISGHSPYEPVFGFSRAVVAGNHLLVGRHRAGAAGRRPEPGRPVRPSQALPGPCIGEALDKAGTSLEHVIRTRMYLTAAEHWPSWHALTARSSPRSGRPPPR